MTLETLADQVIRLWSDGPPSTLEGVGLEIEFRGPYWRRRGFGDAAQCVGADAERPAEIHIFRRGVHGVRPGETGRAVGPVDRSVSRLAR